MRRTTLKKNRFWDAAVVSSCIKSSFVRKVGVYSIKIQCIRNVSSVHLSPASSLPLSPPPSIPLSLSPFLFFSLFFLSLSFSFNLSLSLSACLTMYCGIFAKKKKEKIRFLGRFSKFNPLWGHRSISIDSDLGELQPYFLVVMVTVGSLFFACMQLRDKRCCWRFEKTFVL